MCVCIYVGVCVYIHEIYKFSYSWICLYFSAGKKKVQFLAGKDGNEWVWVMGNHPDDIPIEEILEREAIEKAMKQAEKEAEELR